MQEGARGLSEQWGSACWCPPGCQWPHPGPEAEFGTARPGGVRQSCRAGREAAVQRACLSSGPSAAPLKKRTRGTAKEVKTILVETEVILFRTAPSCQQKLPSALPEGGEVKMLCF